MKEKDPWQSRIPGLGEPPRLGAHPLAWCMGRSLLKCWPFL